MADTQSRQVSVAQDPKDDIDAQGADALPVAAFILAVATFGAFVIANRALGHSRQRTTEVVSASPVPQP